MEFCLKFKALKTTKTRFRSVEKLMVPKNTPRLFRTAPIAARHRRSDSYRDLGPQRHCFIVNSDIRFAKEALTITCSVR